MVVYEFLHLTENQQWTTYGITNGSSKGRKLPEEAGWTLILWL